MGAEAGTEQSKSPVSLPTGTVTFLFSDVEGSSQRWEQHREAMRSVVARQEQVLDAAISSNGGYVFKTVGDAFCAAFPTAPQGVSAAIDAQRLLAKEDFSSVGGLRVRMGLHTGYADERNGDYFGQAVNRVARLMSIGHGGQVLLSGATRELAHNDLPAGVALLDLGSHRLKDLTEAEQVWQVTIVGLPAEFPPLKSLDTLPNNLPIQRTTFVGRDHDVAEVKELVGRHRLLTLVGSGGVGKTRVALQVGADLLEHFPDGVWFVDFAPIKDLELVSSVIAQVLGMSQHEGKRVDESIPPWLKRKKLMLILDNCEHVLEPVAAIAAAIIGTASDVRIMNTSRQVLGISGEEVYRVPSLSVPHTVADLTLAAVAGFGAVALFVDRARSVDKSFVLTDDAAPIVADICRRLDGIPLAIELAAARVKVLSVPNLAQRLNERFKILTGGSRDVLPRQKTLGALIDWSYDLLTPQEQKLFLRLGIFAREFGLEAAVRVCGGDGLDEIEILDLLTSLTDKSLVVADTSGKQERYHLLESTRAYALEKLDPAEREQLARAHAEYFSALAREADERYGTGSTLGWLADVERELDNFRAALEWGLTQGHDAVLVAPIAGGLEQFWYRNGLAVEGRYWIERALERTENAGQPLIVARLLYAQSWLLSVKGAREATERAINLYESAGDRRGAAHARATLAFSLNQSGRLDEAEEAINQTLAAMQEYKDRHGIAKCLRYKGAIIGSRGQMAEARDYYDKSLAILREIGDEIGLSLVHANLGELEFHEGHAQEALKAATDALVLRRGIDKDAIATARCNSAAYQLALNDLTGAHASAREALRIAREVQNAYTLAIALQHFASLAALQRKSQSAAQLLGYVNLQYKELGATREPTEKWCYDMTMTALREQTGDAGFEKLSTEGAGWSEDRAVEEALKI
jgi:predicted ATPase/class 3 adenylate cyclase